MKGIKILLPVLAITLLIIPVGFGLQRDDGNTFSEINQPEAFMNDFTGNMINTLNEETGIMLNSSKEVSTQSAIAFLAGAVTNSGIDIDADRVRTASAISEGDFFQQEDLDALAEEYGRIFKEMDRQDTIEDKSEELKDIMEAFFNSLFE
ncbi:MAG: hypothetical protein GX947_04480 [Tissierellia bacterium]|nr:hypothetical protein [Tissierellia bacterium]